MKFNAEELKEHTRKILADCLQPNGALVAAPTHQPYYPSDAHNYMYVWPGRDAGFVLAAMLLIGEDHYETILRWIWDRAQDFQHSELSDHEGLLYRNYYLNGRIYLHHYQPDQNGTLLWSIGFKQEYTKQAITELERKVVEKAADAILRVWDNDHFTVPIEDLWEERRANHGQGTLTYSLAACVSGLRAAGRLLNANKFTAVADEMEQVIQQQAWNTEENMIARLFGGNLGFDMVTDSSLSGLVWPFQVGLDNDQLQRIVDVIEQDTLEELGILRYPGDTYEGALGKGHNHENVRAGAWPLLTFWLAIAYQELGNTQKAEHYFNSVFKNVEDYYLPEQLFCCSTVPWTGVKPLLWSNAMAVFAAWKLGKL